MIDHYKISLSCLFLVLCFSACQFKTIRIRENGRLQERYKINRKTAQKEGFNYLYHSNKKIAVEEYYENGVQQGAVKTYYSDGTLESIAYVKDGDYMGRFEYYYPDGKLKQTGFYANNQINGDLTSYYPNGQIKEVVRIKDNHEIGPFREYSPKGILTAQGSYITNGEMEALEQGLLYMYNDSTGRLSKKMRCRAGICCTIWNNQEGYVLPSSDLCADIISQTDSIILTPPQKK